MTVGAAERVKWVMVFCKTKPGRSTPEIRRRYASTMSTIHFVGGEKGGVGKSVFARLLAQYFIDKQIPFTALDADVSNASLLRVYAEYCRPVDLTQVDSADDIFTLASESPDRHVLVDLPAQSERPLATWMDNGGIADLVEEMQIRLVFWHVMDDSKDAVVALSRLLSRYGDSVRYCVVKNAGRGKDFSLFDHSPVRAEAERLRPTSWNCPSSTARSCARSIVSTPVTGPPSTTPRLARVSRAWSASGSRSGSGGCSSNCRRCRFGVRPGRTWRTKADRQRRLKYLRIGGANAKIAKANPMPK
jgi:hypothetical protein